MVTIKMIAKKCGYSTATVSKALNGAPDISTETADFIRKTAEEMGYMPNAAARMLKTSRSYNFGVVLEHMSNWGLTHHFFFHVLNGFKCRADELGYSITFISERLGDRQVGFVSNARYRNCDGVLIANADFKDPMITELADSGIPLVTIDHMYETSSAVVSDNVGGMEMLVRYAHSMGHRRLAFIYGEETAVTHFRIASFCKTCSELGLDVPDEYLVPGQFTNPGVAQKATEQLLRLPNPPTCILYPDDLACIGGFNAAERMGLRVPDDLSLIGYDGIDVGQMFRPRLTTLMQYPQKMGEQAAEELVRAVEQGRTHIPRRITIPGTLIPGETVKEINPAGE